MKRTSILLTSCTLFTACQNQSIDQVVSQTFVHKYGFETSAQEWKEREQDGQVVTVLKNGVRIVRSYDNGKLHGSTTTSFPNSPIVETVSVYDQGILLKEMVNDPSGMPIREEIYEFDNRTIVTNWDEKGAPLSIEEYSNDLLVEGKYYTEDHILEASVEGGNGTRIKRDRTGNLLSSDEMRNGLIATRTTFHPNGNIHTISRYKDYELDGVQIKYTASGKPLMEMSWKEGVLDGPKVTYRNGSVITIIPYVNGEKQGVEYHYDDLGHLTAEIHWQNDHKHGSTQFHSEEGTEMEWYFKGQTVSAEKFQNLEAREHIAIEFNEPETTF